GAGAAGGSYSTGGVVHGTSSGFTESGPKAASAFSSSSIDCGRFSGSFSRQRITSAASPSGKGSPLLSLPGSGGGGWRTIFIARSRKVAPSKGGAEVSSS